MNVIHIQNLKDQTHISNVYDERNIMKISTRKWPISCLPFLSLLPLLFILSGCDAETSANKATVIDKSSQPESNTEKKPSAKANQLHKAVVKKDTPTKTEKHHGKANRLKKETSPYLLLHAYNPVDWYPWGEEALKKAKKEKKLIFLSIGYSSCYWCHVMERKCFMDKKIAEYLNKHFICIKVDREERPDIDEIYMTALQATGGRGGWPLSMFLLPDTKPVVGGTYWPAKDFTKVLQTIQTYWQKEPEKMKKQGAELTTALAAYLSKKEIAAPVKLNDSMVTKVNKDLYKLFDADHGGFSSAKTKFPSPSNLVYLLDRLKSGKDDHDKEMLITTLEKMQQGGIRDHIGGGFHRYSVDPQWDIPHFEKMLYDNAQLATVYSEAYALTQRDDFKRVVEELLEFIIREMTDKNGGFYSALDAETDKVEGKYYIWTKAELEKLFNKDELQLVMEIYTNEAKTNFEHEGHEYYVLQLNQSLKELAKVKKMKLVDLLNQRAAINQKLLKYRSNRKRPLCDIKILTGWNGLMIKGFADAGRILKQEKYILAAEKAANFVLSELRSNGRLLRSHTGGKAQLNAYLSDYAFLVDGLIALHRATGEQKWLTVADELTQMQIKLFWDKKAGGFFFTSIDHEKLIARSKTALDSVIPAGNSVAADNLLYLAKTLKKTEYLKKAEATLQSMGRQFESRPAEIPRATVALRKWLNETSKQKKVKQKK